MEKDNALTRCFIALEISREAIEEIEDIQKLIKKKGFFVGKFTEGENLHLTLKFLGEITEEKIEEARKKLREIKQNKFKASLGELGFFSKDFLRILWLKLQGKEIWELQKQIDEKLGELGFEREERFMSHITLARIKKVLNREDFVSYVKSLRHRKVEFEVKEFILKKSELREEGPVYSDLEKFELK